MSGMDIQGSVRERVGVIFEDGEASTGVANRDALWSPGKKTWCCKHAKRGCTKVSRWKSGPVFFRVELAHTVGFGRWFSTFFYWMWPVLDFNSIFLTMKGMQGMDWLSLNCACSNAVQMLDYTSVLKMKKIGRHAQEQWCHFKQRPFGVPPER